MHGRVPKAVRSPADLRKGFDRLSALVEPGRIACAVLAQPIGRVGAMAPGRSARFNAWAETIKDHPEATSQVLDAFHQNLYGPGFVYSVDRAFVASCRTPCLVLAGNDEAHPYAISEEVAKLLPNCEFIPEWKEGAALTAAKVRIKQFLADIRPPPDPPQGRRAISITRTRVSGQSCARPDPRLAGGRGRGEVLCTSAPDRATAP